MGAGGLRQRLRHREDGREAVRRAEARPADPRPVPDRGRSTSCNRAQNYVQLFDPKVRLLPGPRRERHVPADARAVRPARLGLRLHRDRRLELRVPRAAGRPGPGQPLRRPGRPGDEARQVLRDPGGRACTPAATAASSTRCSRRATSGWASCGISNQLSHHIPYMYDYAGQPSKTAGEGPRGPVAALLRQRDRPGLRRATRTTARCRRGSCSARWASTRCRWATATTPSGHRCSRRRRSTWTTARR